MSYEEDWPDHTFEDRVHRIRETIRPASHDELTALGVSRFPSATDPWCERYNQFLAEHRNAHCYFATTPEGAEIVYCRETESGVWFLPGSAVGILMPKGLAALREIVDGM